MNDIAESVNGAAQAQAEAPVLMFPNTLNMEGVAVTVYADGTWSGDGDAFLAAARTVRQSGDAVMTMLIWLVANAIRSSSRRTEVPGE